MEPKTYLDVVGSTRSIVNEVRHSFQPDRVERAAESTRNRLRDWYELDPATLAAIGSETVHVDPVMASAAYAYPDLNWKPLPIFQSYTAYTSALDGLDADLLRSDAAPRSGSCVTSSRRTTRSAGRVDRSPVRRRRIPPGVGRRPIPLVGIRRLRCSRPSVAMTRSR